LNPAHPEVAPHLEAVVRELASAYPIDGIHFDYARLPRRIRSLDPISRTSFAASEGAGGVDPLTLVDRKAARSRYGVAEAEQLTALWEGWSQAQVSVVIARMSAAARAARPGIMVSAAVYPDPAMARAELSQAWDRWLADRVIDVAVPMCYAADSEIARSNLAVARESTGGRLWAGLGVYNKPLGEALAGAELAKKLGYEGVSIFSYGAAREAGPRASSAIAAALAGFARP
ncbi:MAG TPA: family 10 glycosylhydrolase, partial [Candidatus Udaeobacter sp.]|nr:family 10 glycosylhydrolase [Candidatus Udaeobacter sp.]